MTSKAASIHAALKTKLEALASIKYVADVQPAGVEELERYAGTQLPMVAMLFGLPTPRGETLPMSTAFDMSLPVSLTFYAQDNETPAETMLDLANEFWASMYEDADKLQPFFGGLVREIHITPDSASLYAEPYVMFNIGLELVYVTTTSSL